MEEKRPFFVKSSDSDIRKLVWNVVSEIDFFSLQLGSLFSHFKPRDIC